MAFFDKKSEVISIELTSYGKYLLSKGKFKPVYYEFLDNDIIYDSSYAGVSNEHRNNISERIKNETPRTKTQYVFSGIETKIKELNKVKRKLKPNDPTKEDDLIENFQVFEKLHFNASPIGNSNLDEKIPALNFSMYNAEILSVNTVQNYNSHIVNVPLINLKDITFSASILQSETEVADPMSLVATTPIGAIQQQDVITEPLQIEPSATRTFPDGTYISIEDKTVLMNFYEQNLKQNSENFEIEIFTYETGSDGSEIIKQLYFDNSQTNEIVDDSNKVEYYFEILADNNISEQDSKLISNIKDTVVFPTKK